jgi:CDP-glucose 4,6-dehydratase
VENLVIDPDFWRGRRVYLTGHTGFKGSWMSLLLSRMGALVTGFALAPDQANGAFGCSGIEHEMVHEIGDIRDATTLQSSLAAAAPDVIFHMAAQALVRR